MSTKATIQRATGMLDVLTEDRLYWDYVIAQAIVLAHRYGFQRIDVPVLEYTELFARGVGEASDFFVQKEMYSIDEPDGSSLTLRPEFTAGIVRAYLQNGMTNLPQPVKLYAIGPVFRRERPQAGRYRQHTQFNIEIIGEMDPAADVEVMMLGANLLRDLGYQEVNFQLNSIGCRECAPKYIAALKRFLAAHRDKLEPIDQERLRRNPLRILDSKEAGMDELLANAPHTLDYLCDTCANHFGELCDQLDMLDQPYTVNHRLVRGIDYYTKTVFEVWAAGIGAQAAVFSGGRYDNLAEDIGGPPTPGIGFGCGIERVILGLKEQGIEPPATPEPAVMIAHFGGETKKAAVKLAFQLRAAGIGTRLAFAENRRSLKSQMREANKRNIKTVLILGESELEAQAVMVRPLDGGEQVRVATAQIVAHLQQQ